MDSLIFSIQFNIQLEPLGIHVALYVVTVWVASRSGGKAEWGVQEECCQGVYEF